MERKTTKKVWGVLAGLLIGAAPYGNNLQAVAHGAIPIAERVGQLLTGEEYSISNKEEFGRFRELVNSENAQQGAKVILLNDLDLTEEQTYTPVGNTLLCPFRGEFDGKNHEVQLDIRNISYTRYESFRGSVGVFGVTRGAGIRNLKVTGGIEIDGNMTNTGCLGAVVGLADYTTFFNCCNECEITVRNSEVVGGIVGFLGRESGLFMCCNEGDILANGCDVCGGIAATSESEIGAIACYNIGNIELTGREGIPARVCGIIGDYSNARFCYNAGEIVANGSASAWGVCVAGAGHVEENCYTTNYAVVGQQKSEQEMQTPEFVKELNAAAGIEVYRYVEGEFPEFAEI